MNSADLTSSIDGIPYVSTVAAALALALELGSLP